MAVGEMKGPLRSFSRVCLGRQFRRLPLTTARLCNYGPQLAKEILHPTVYKTGIFNAHFAPQYIHRTVTRRSTRALPSKEAERTTDGSSLIVPGKWIVNLDFSLLYVGIPCSIPSPPFLQA